MAYQVNFTFNVSEDDADDRKTAALEAYKQLMVQITGQKFTVGVKDAAGVSKDIELTVEEADDYAGIMPPAGGMA